jgi:RND family efflux transporter MFP subunit
MNRIDRTPLLLAVLLALFAPAAGCGRRATEPVPVLLPASTAAAPAPAAPASGFIGVVVAGEWVDVQARVEGRLQSVFVKPGDRVRRGTPLAQLDTSASRHDLTAGRAALREASRRFLRRKRLARSTPDAVTVEELDASRREVAQARARVAQLRDAAAEAIIRAPVDGTVVQRLLPVGALAAPGRAVARVAASGQLRVRFAIPQERAGSVAAGDRVSVSIQGERQARPGRIVDLSPEIDATTHLVFAAAALEGSAQPDLVTGVAARVFPWPDRAASP